MVRLLALLVVASSLLWGCAKHSSGVGAAEAPEGYGRGYAMDEAEGAPAARADASRKTSAAPPPPPRPPAAPAAEAAAPEPSPDVPATDPAAPQAAARMVHYNGWLRLRVARVDEGVDAVKALAAEKGGFVERIGADHVVVRVPVARFREAFDAARALGEVLGKSITADDVTEAFTAVDLRLRTALATRERLQLLLAKAQDEQEKLALLREIQRITEDIDRMEAQLRTLASLADFSRITVELVPREALAWQGPEDETAELAWIRQLSPFRTDFPVESRKLALDAPAGMVKLDERGRFVAESPDGARIWTHRVRNRPEGDAAFWLAALKERLARDFATAEALEIGDWRALRLVDRSEEPYTWTIAVRVDGDWLHVAQVWYPSAAAEARYREAVRRSLLGEPAVEAAPEPAVTEAPAATPARASVGGAS